MATTNPVNQVLITKDSSSLLGAGSTVNDLTPGQIGLFNYHTGLSLDPSSTLAEMQDVFLAVGVDRTGDGLLEDINKSAGQMIQVRNVKSFTLKPYAAPQPKIIELTGFTAQCETDYGIKIEFRNQKIYGVNGYNQFAKTFTYRTTCCDKTDCSSCPQGDCNDLAQGLVTEVNADTDGLVTSSMFASKNNLTITAEPSADGTFVFTIGTTQYSTAIVNADTVSTAAAKIVVSINSLTNTPYFAKNTAGVITIYSKASKVSNYTGMVVATVTGVAGMTTSTAGHTTEVVTVAGLAAFESVNTGVCLSVKIQSVPMKVNNYSGGINLKYESSRETQMIISSTNSFECNGTITTTLECVGCVWFGYDIKQLEYVAGGWNGKPGPYRVSTVTGLAREGFESFAVTGTKYTQIVLTYDIQSVGGWQEYLNNIETIVAVPCGDTNSTLVELVSVLDRLFTNRLSPLSDLASEIDCNGQVGSVSTIDGLPLGLDSVA